MDGRTGTGAIDHPAPRPGRRRRQRGRAADDHGHADERTESDGASVGAETRSDLGNRSADHRDPDESRSRDRDASRQERRRRRKRPRPSNGRSNPKARRRSRNRPTRQASKASRSSRCQITGTNMATLTAEGLPAGLSLNRLSSTEGVISGTPSSTESAVVTLKASNPEGATFEATFGLAGLRIRPEGLRPPDRLARRRLLGRARHLRGARNGPAAPSPPSGCSTARRSPARPPARSCRRAAMTATRSPAARPRRPPARRAR